jgi:hypothetical protein
VRRIDATSGAVTTLAGVADADPDYADGAATDARFNGLGGIAVDGKTGTVYVSDRNNDRIRRIMPDGETTTLAGSGAFGHQDGPHDTASFGALTSLTLDGAGAYLYVADAGNDLIRRISTSDGSVTTVVGTPGVWGTVPGPLPAILNAPTGVAWDTTGPGHLLISVPDAILRAAVIEPGHMIVTSGESIALTPTETTTYTLTVTDSDGATSTETASVTVAPLVSGMALLAGEINGRGNTDGVGALARFRNPGGVAVDGSGNVFVADSGNSTIRKITPDGAVSTLAGTADQTGDVDAKGADARFNYPNAMTMDANGNLYVIDANNAIRKITPDGGVTHVTSHEPGSPAPFPFGFLSSLVVDGSGTLFVTDSGNSTIDRIAADGTVTTLAGLAEQNETPMWRTSTATRSARSHPQGRSRPWRGSTARKVSRTARGTRRFSLDPAEWPWTAKAISMWWIATMTRSV